MDASDPGPKEIILHASCVAVEGRGLLILGASGAGKSTLALDLMANGARLVGDDRLILRTGPQGLTARPHPTLDGLIEARGIGILTAATAGETPVMAAVDLDRSEPERIPPCRHACFLGQKVLLLWRVEGPHFVPALLQFLRSGRQEPQDQTA